jgi:low affinity Fe/Cu permease
MSFRKAYIFNLGILSASDKETAVAETTDRRASKQPSSLRQISARFASAVTQWTGSSWGFATAAAVVVIWAATGPMFHWSDTWQLVINTGTTIVTFLMVFLIQRTQNKDGRAIQLKLNELVAAIEGASNRLIDVEDLSEDDMEVLHLHYQRLVQMARKDENVASSHSVEEAEMRHSAKNERRRRQQGSDRPEAGRR